MNAKKSVVSMFKGVSNWTPYWQFHFGEGGGFKLGTILAVSFGEGGRGTSAGRLVNFDSLSEIGYRTPTVFRMISEDQ